MPSVLDSVDLTRLDADVHDCIQVNLSALADAHHGDRSRLRLGSRLDFAPGPGPGGLPTVEPTVSRCIELSVDLLGLGACGPLTDVAQVRLTADPVYAVADAFDLPWVPYHGRQHLEHSFLLAAGPQPDEATVLDAYHNETPWGSARPQRRIVPVGQLTAAIGAGGLRTIELRPTALPALPVEQALRANAERLHAACESGVVEGYLRAYQEHPDRLAAAEQLTLQTWLLARSRRLHGRWLARCQPDRPIEAVLAQGQAWASLAEHTYLALRRVQRGRPEPPGLTDRLRELLLTDVRLARTLVEEHPWTPARSSRP